MSLLFPFRAVRPAPQVAARVASVPYDVVSTDEARALARDEPLSFLRVTRPEVDLAAGTSPYAEAVYQQAVVNFEDLQRSAPFVQEAEPSLYFYQLAAGGHAQMGLAGCFSVGEYDAGLIKKHEKTRKDKEDDRTRHLLDLRAQTGVVFLTYRAHETVDGIAKRIARTPPLYDFTAKDDVRHTVWRVTGADLTALVAAFGTMTALYIADGHHRAASASRARATLASRGGQVGGADRFVAVAFPDNQVRILAYNRIVKDLGGRTPDDLLDAISARMAVAPGRPTPAAAGHVSMYLAGRWHDLTLPRPRRAGDGGKSPSDCLAASLDVEILQRQVLEPLLGVGDPRTDKRIDFVGGIRGTGELERLVSSGQAAAAFSMFPVGMHDLLGIADAGGIMPPKSTWFEPKLRDGLLVHKI
jgi:uncharacterized protein (DUF1015 family)